ncbi:MAG TPA: hypothetical protein VK790_09280 [Solirubrobacteraceae bacterium]|jgi:hypothetical protein|nr:hypothetical protein [Solirubrobacteraceae bacterium]
MTEVSSVNGMTGAVVLSASNVEAVPASEVGSPKGVASLDGGGQLSAAQLPTWVVDGSGPAPSGDETGATDTAALIAAAPAEGALIVRAGDYYVTELPTITPGKGIRTIGGMAVFYMVGTGTCLRIHNPSFPTEGGPVEFANNMPGKSGGFVIDLSKAGSKAVGVHLGDIYATGLDGIIVRNGTGAENVGWLFESEIGWCERTRISNCHSVNNAICVKFANSGTATGSFDYSNIEISLSAQPGQHGIVMQNGISLVGAQLKFGGNFFTGEGNTGVVWKLGADNSNVRIYDAHVTFQFEVDGESGLGHKTIEKGSSAESHTTGVIAFLKGSVSFAAGNITVPSVQFTHSGLISIDENLGENQHGEGLNVVGGSTWSRGFVTVKEAKLEVAVQGGDYFTATLASGSNALKLANVYPGRARRIALILTQPKEGAKGLVNWTEPGNNLGGKAQTVSWAAGGGIAPTLQTANGAVDVVELVTADGEHWYASILGPGGSEAEAIDSYLRIMRPIYAGSLIPSSESIIGTAFRAIFGRVVAPRSGTLHDLTVFNGFVNGNHNVAVFDTGQTTTGKYTPLWESGSVASAGENKPQVVGSPELAVVSGEEFMFAVMSSSPSQKYGQAPSASHAAWMQLPANFIPTSGGALPKVLAYHNYSELKYAAIAESEMENSATTPLIILGRIA